MADDVLLNKAAIIERCVNRVEEEYQNDEGNLLNFTKQDSIILNLERACEAALDITARMIKNKKLGIPQDSRHSVDLLEQANFLTADLSKKIKQMVGFRNIAVHDYQELNLSIVKSIIDNHLCDLREMAKLAIQWASED